MSPLIIQRVEIAGRPFICGLGARVAIRSAPFRNNAGQWRSVRYVAGAIIAVCLLLGGTLYAVYREWLIFSTDNPLVGEVRAAVGRCGLRMQWQSASPPTCRRSKASRYGCFE